VGAHARIHVVTVLVASLLHIALDAAGDLGFF
jgi:hypothetical protein